MPSILKLFYTFVILISYSIPLCIAPTESHAQSEILNEIKKRQNTGKTMQTRTLKPSKSSNKEEEKAPSETKDETDNISDATPERELTEDEKLWKKYKDLSDGKKPEEQAQTNTDPSPETSQPVKQTEDSTPDAPDSEANDLASNENDASSKKEKEEQKPEEQGTVLMDIVKEYKESNRKKGALNTRSYGEID